jgi:hypothetical protein
MAQPTTRRDQASRTTQQYTFPSRGGVLGEVGYPQLVRAVAAEVAADQVGDRDQPPGPLAPRAGRPASPARRISRLTVLCPIVTPWP